MKTEFLTPVGRLVQGDPFEAQTKNMRGQPLMTMSGQPTQRYFIAVAFPKMVDGKPNAEFGALWAQLDQVGRGSFPALNIAPPWDPDCRFSWKVMDGDGVDDNGKSNANKEGFAGHWVVKFQSSFAPKCFHAGHYQLHEHIQDPKAIRRGYYVRVAGTAEGNGNVQKPGIYVNLGMVELAGIGTEITTGPDAAAVFGGNVPMLPVGAQPLPMHAGSALPAAPSLPVPAPAPAAAPGNFPPVPGPQPMPAPLAAAPGNFPPVPGPQPMPAPLAAAPALPSPIPVVPNTAILGGPPPAPAPAFQMTAAAGGFTREQYHAQGWTDDMLRAKGMML
jgi:hypothetical protein